ncbi:MAG: cytochrome C [Ginsengibacter sp.]
MKRVFIFLILVIIIILLAIFIEYKGGKKKLLTKKNISAIITSGWSAPDSNKIPGTPEGSLIKYGRNLITNTSYYFGPAGIISKAGNGMNCQNCHMDAGTKMFGNNYSLVANAYPRYKERSGSVETVEKKVQDCFERSMNGYVIDRNGKEMKAFVAYLNWVGSNVTKSVKPPGSGIEELPFLDKAADTLKGRIVYISKCQTCHGKNGEGQLLPHRMGYLYPPVWGENSYNIGASIYRISKLAGFVKNNMPLGASHEKPQLSNEESWNVAALINANYHPYKNISGDWPNLNTKPFDYPFGPYAGNKFSEEAHKFGPFAPIKNYYANKDKK